MNKLSLVAPQTDVWTIVTTQRGKDKLVSLGYSYTIDKKNNSTINWRCDLTWCPGRATSDLKGPPVTITIRHYELHLPNPKLRQTLLDQENLKLESKRRRADGPGNLVREVYSGSTDPELVSLAPSEEAKRQIVNRNHVKFRFSVYVKFLNSNKALTLVYGLLTNKEEGVHFNLIKLISN